MIQKIINYIEEYDKVAILGLGKEGLSTYNFIRKFLPQKKLTIIDSVNKADVINDSFVDFIYGDNYLANLNNYDLIIKSPGISLKDLKQNSLKGKITSQLELILKFNAKNVIGVTGTKGKSTTSSLLYQVLKANEKDVFLLGNIGTPIFSKIEEFKENSLLVIEMSSHQLEFIDASPHYGIILNLFADHLDHAGSLKHYHECKLNMFKYQKEDDISIYCSDNEYLKKYMMSNDYQGLKYRFQLNEPENKKQAIYLKDKQVYYEDKVLFNENSPRYLIGEHNLKNIMVVLLLSEILKLDLNITKKVIGEFKGLAYRMEYVGTYDDIKFYCDTIATIPEATIAALKSINDTNTLIIGGQDRHISYDKLIDFLENSDVQNIICMPTTGHTIGKQIKNKNIIFVDTLKDAVTTAKKFTKKGMTCLLSPAAASYEYYKNFEEKGEAFKALIKDQE